MGLGYETGAELFPTDRVIDPAELHHALQFTDTENRKNIKRYHQCNRYGKPAGTLILNAGSSLLPFGSIETAACTVKYTQLYGNYILQQPFLLPQCRLAMHDEVFAFVMGTK